MADQALATISRHLWYLTPASVILALFSDEVDNDEKEEMRLKLLDVKEFYDPANFEVKKPIFPEIYPNTQLVDLITVESMQFFTITKLSYSWLELKVEYWGLDPDFNIARTWAKTVKVTNDLAERCVKLSTDYSKVLTRKIETRDNIIQEVESNRREYPNFKKSTFNK